MFSTDFEKSSNFKLNENPSGGSRIVTCGQTDIRMGGRTDRTKPTVTSQFFKCA